MYDQVVCLVTDLQLAMELHRLQRCNAIDQAAQGRLQAGRSCEHVASQSTSCLLFLTVQWAEITSRAVPRSWGDFSLPSIPINFDTDTYEAVLGYCGNGDVHLSWIVSVHLKIMSNRFVPHRGLHSAYDHWLYNMLNIYRSLYLARNIVYWSWYALVDARLFSQFVSAKYISTEIFPNLPFFRIVGILCWYSSRPRGSGNVVLRMMF